MSNDICLQCRTYSKRPDYQFCSPDCTRDAAANAPGFLPIPTDHVMYQDVEKKFIDNWKGGNRPYIHDIYLATWSSSMRSSFDDYRDQVESRGNFAGRRNKAGGTMSAGNEKKLFRGARRACGFGDTTLAPCYDSSCQLCQTLRAGFDSHLASKKNNTNVGVRLGAGLYTSKTSSKAYDYAKNIGNASGSSTRILMSCRVVVGRPFDTTVEAPHSDAPAGYDAVYGKPGPGSMFPNDEYVVYTADAIRVAYILVLS